VTNLGALSMESGLWAATTRPSNSSKFEVGTNQVLNQTNQLLGDCRPDQLPSLNWENCVNCSVLWVRCSARI